MRHQWTQPSLSRDFALLSAAILFVLCIISAVVTYSTYTRHIQRITIDLEKESAHIERSLATEMESAQYLLSSLGKQIVLDPDRNLTHLAQILKSFDNRSYIYTILSWINPEHMLVVSSDKGVRDEPIDISDRDYVQAAAAEPWKMAIGRPIEGRASERWIIPVAMGISDYTGKFIGTIMLSIDIHSLTDRISNLVGREGVSFAIVGKTLVPLTQVSEDKDFVTKNFPAEKMAGVNFTQQPYGMITQGSPLWGSTNYSYYRVSSQYPYVILVSYDSQYSDETVRNLLRSRLLQMGAMAVFFLLFILIARSRIIKPVLDMTNIATDIANGKPYTPLPQGGPVEIEALSHQLKRVSEYIDENKRIEDELRNKMFMLKKAKEQAEMIRRSQSEFIAYVSQEMRTPLNNIIGGAQVMKDQLYGPLENRKYRQYATDIYNTGNTLLDETQGLLTLSKMETGYMTLAESQVDVATSINKAMRFVTDKTQSEQLGIKINMQEPLPKLIADDFRLQQVIINLLLHMLNVTENGRTITLDARTIAENRDKVYFALTLSNSEKPLQTQADLLAQAERIMSAPVYRLARVADLLEEKTNIGLELAKLLMHMHQGHLGITPNEDGSLTIMALLGASRIRFSDEHSS